MKNHIDIHTLIKFFQHELSDDQSAEVECRINSSDENMAEAEQLYHLLFASNMLKYHSPEMIERELVLLHCRVRGNRIGRLVRMARRAAAVIVIPLAIFALFTIFSPSSPTEYITVSSNAGTVTSFTLPDSSQVWLNSCSSMRYPSRFEGGNREVVLEGEAYFKVIRHQGTTFTVSTLNGVRVDVLGTEFNVEAYERDSFIATTLVTGRIDLSYADTLGRHHKVEMHPEQRTIIDRTTMAATTYSANTTTEVAWREGKIIFDDTSLENALRIMGKFYNVDFIISSPALKSYHFSGAFHNSRLEQILEHFYISTDIHHRYLEPRTDGRTLIEIY